MAKTRGTTSERGLGYAHQQERRRLLPLAYNTSCPLCGWNMARTDRLDLDHVVPRAFGGSTEVEGGRIVHAYCNRAEGPRVRRALRHQWAVEGTSEVRSRRW